MSEECKFCTKCHQIKSVDAFHRDARNKDGRCHVCTRCKALARRQREAAQSTPEELLLRQARQTALWALVENHRAEFDTLVSREKLALEQASLRRDDDENGLGLENSQNRARVVAPRRLQGTPVA